MSDCFVVSLLAMTLPLLVGRPDIFEPSETEHYEIIYRNIDRLSSVLYGVNDNTTMTKFLLWLVVLFFCWPLALAALFLYPIVWLFLLPFRIVGIAVDGILQTLRAVILLPARVLGGTRTT
jgi:hypothetical protein